MASVGSLHPQLNITYIGEMREKIQAGQYQLDPNDLLGKKKKETISDVWPGSPPDGLLHIFVDAPPGVNPNISSE